MVISLLVMTMSCSNERQVGKITLESNLELAVGHYMNMMNSLGLEDFPRSYEKEIFTTSKSDWWCSGFYPGTLLYLYEATGDTTMLSEAERMLKLLEKEQFNTTTHDLGFMMYCSFGNALRLAPKPEYEDILLNSAKSLSTRFSPEVGCIKSWDSAPEDYLVIIDNMMNLELLFWATKYTGDSTYYNIAVTHANTTIQNHFREDYSTYHVLNYASDGSGVKAKRTAQGLSDSSSWARGQVWGLYGFTVMYRETKDQKYLEQAVGIAEFLLTHSNLPKDKVPMWDFDAHSSAERDASAAAIMASALLELDTYSSDKGYAESGGQILGTLSTSYVAPLGSNANFIIQHCVGDMPKDSEVDVPLTYADYYFIEGLLRNKK